MLYSISLSYATFGIEVENNIVVRAAPIARWCMGKSIDNVLFYYKNKGAKIVEIGKAGFQVV
jgi:hypothetical protein